jgi:hypothetical protein
MFPKRVTRPEPPLDPQLERFRQALAEAFLDGERAGSLSIVVDLFTTVSGPWWRRTSDARRWGFEWLFVHDPEFNARHRHAPYPYDDGAEIGVAAFDELLSDSFDLRGRTYALRWMTRLAAPELWQNHFDGRV